MKRILPNKRLYNGPQLFITQGQMQLLLLFVNKVLLEHSHIILFSIVYNYFSATKAEWSNYNRNQMA